VVSRPSQDDAGLFGALIIGGGLLGAMIAGPVLDATHAYRPMLKIGAAIAGLGSIYFVVRARNTLSHSTLDFEPFLFWFDLY
jgi:branched-subunit amino acid transport protein